jgi:hypothetical protein
MTLYTTTLSTTTLSKMTLTLIKFRIKFNKTRHSAYWQIEVMLSAIVLNVFMPRSKIALYAQCLYAECLFAECRGAFVVSWYFNTTESKAPMEAQDSYNI